MFGEGLWFQKANNLQRKQCQTMTLRICKSGLISLSSHNGFLSCRRTESWETSHHQSLPQISELDSFSLPCFILICAWSVTWRLRGLWRQRIRFWCWVLTLGSEVWLRKPPSLPPSPLLCSLCICSSLPPVPQPLTHFLHSSHFGSQISDKNCRVLWNSSSGEALIESPNLPSLV